MQTINHNVEQGSPEWLLLRLGRMTASNATAIATNGKGLDTYCDKLAAERLTGIPAENYAGNDDIKRGHDLEESARQIYSMTYGEVSKVGFISYGDYAGCSPDGLVGDDGGIEIKSPNDVKFMRVVLDGEIESGYMAQIQMCLLITGRKWWDYICYNPHFKQPLYVKRVMPDKAKHEALLAGISSGESKIKSIIIKMEAVK